MHHMASHLPSTNGGSSLLAAESARSSLKRARALFDRTAQDAFVPSYEDPAVQEASVQRRVRLYYNKGQVGAAIKSSASSTTRATGRQLTVHQTTATGDRNEASRSAAAVGGALMRLNDDETTTGTSQPPPPQEANKKKKAGGILVRKADSAKTTTIPTPAWHAPWRLSTVLSSHLGWVRSIAFDPTNDFFATGGADRVIKLWDLAKASVGAEDALKLTLTGHISPIRGLAFSPRHPYLFSCGEDKMVKCWDLETNQVIRHYHGHLSGVFCLSLHPTLDLLVTGGRDAVARVWDMRTKAQVHVLSGHEHTVASIVTQSTDPQVITGSHDATVKLWDLAAGKCLTTLTHHKKSIRALCMPSFERTFLSGAADALKQWQSKDGRFLKSFTGHKAVINALAVNDDGVVVSGGDDGSLHFWDYATGHNFQQTSTIAQPGSLEAENGIFATAFDGTGTRLVTCEADKTIKIWKEDEEASELTHPVNMAAWRKKCLAEAKQRY